MVRLVRFGRGALEYLQVAVLGGDALDRVLGLGESRHFKFITTNERMSGVNLS
jgi:hypothetical protein